MTTETTKKKRPKSAAYRKGFADGAVSMKWSIICELNYCVSKIQELRHEGLAPVIVRKRK